MVGMLVERIAYRPLRKRKATRLATLISAIGASIFLQELVRLIPTIGKSSGMKIKWAMLSVSACHPPGRHENY